MCVSQPSPSASIPLLIFTSTFAAQSPHWRNPKVEGMSKAECAEDTIPADFEYCCGSYTSSVVDGELQLVLEVDVSRQGSLYPPIGRTTVVRVAADTGFTPFSDGEATTAGSFRALTVAAIQVHTTSLFSRAFWSIFDCNHSE